QVDGYRKLVPFSIVLFQRNIGCCFLYRAPGNVARHAEKIAGERTLGRIVALGLSHQRQKDFLRGLFGRGGIAAHVQRKAVNAALVSLIQSPERAFVPLGELPQQLLVITQAFCHGWTSSRLCSSYFALRGLENFFQNFSCSHADRLTANAARALTIDGPR